MYCPKCGSEIKPNTYFCGRCGFQAFKNDNVIKPIVTNVGYDDTLPKNSNFAIVIIVILTVIAGLSIYLGAYKEKYNFANSVSYEGYNFYIPIGYATKREKSDKNDKEYLYIYNNSISYSFDVSKDSYDYYVSYDPKTKKYNNNMLEFELEKTGAKDISITNKDDNTAIATFKKDDTKYYFFIYRLSDEHDKVLSGFVYANSLINDEDIDLLYQILARIK